MNVNIFLWRGALETISFMPLNSADQIGGTIITDWYSTPGNNNERCKLNIFITGKSLNTENLKVTSFCQEFKNQIWINKKIDSQSIRSSSKNSAYILSVCTEVKELNMTKKKNVIITGAAGLVGTTLRQYWADRYSLRLADIQRVENLQVHEDFTQLDITDLEAFTTACQGMDVLVHLAADRSPTADFYESLLEFHEM